MDFLLEREVVLAELREKESMLQIKTTTISEDEGLNTNQLLRFVFA